MKERDPYTGVPTTGHEWNGIKELNTPVPMAVWFFLIVTALFSLGYWVLMPAWPTGLSYTKGLLGIDQRNVVREDLAEATRERDVWARRIEAKDYAAIQADPVLMRFVRQSGRALFGDNCAVCHGINAKGGPGFPSLVGRTWLWGGTPDAIAETIRVGVNSSHESTRVSQMMAFGRDRVLERDAVRDVVSYVRSLSSAGANSGAAPHDTGRRVFAEQCVSCHGENAKGRIEVGAPDLTDDFWLYGGDAQSVYASVYGGRQGQMPSWEWRLSATDRKLLTLYLLDLGSARK
jgi:cytochrome c oxidase cbb3-type subunit 3